MRRPQWLAARAVVFAAALAVEIFAAAPCTAGAQGGSIDAQCGTATLNERVTQDACQKAIDLFQFMAPQLGAALSGGNAVLGEHSALRGFGHFSLGLRANAVQGRLPRVDERTPSLTGAVSSSYTTTAEFIPAPVVDAAVGLFRGFPFAGSYALGVDALVNIAYIPSVDATGLSVNVPDGSLKFGFGGRLGLLAETFVTPGISVTVIRRELPTVNVRGRVSGDDIRVDDVQVRTTAWRVVAGKNLTVFGLAVGAGQDSYDTRADAQVTVNRTSPAVTSGVMHARQTLTRTNIFANASLNLASARLVAEIGRASGGTLSTFNTFDAHRADDPRSYASLGLRVSW
ncbi:MAG: hypothetical protein IT359_06310 [Gemmatimonadaceae bacterium]|nr:hypothetical protein [Gemmatimonadaceae bacterium]